LEKTARQAQAAIAGAEAIRYIQLGNPETIVIDDGEILPRLEKHFKRLASAA
jgi:hypothetical protein